MSILWTKADPAAAGTVWRRIGARKSLHGWSCLPGLGLKETGASVVWMHVRQEWSRSRVQVNIFVNCIWLSDLWDSKAGVPAFVNRSVGA